MVMGTHPRRSASQSEFTIPYQDPCSRCETHWWFRFGLPGLTMSPIWVWTYRVPPLPIITTAKEYNTHLTRVCVIWCYNDLVIKHSDWLWLGPNLTCNLIDALCSRHGLGYMFWTWCGQGCGTCGAQSMTCVWLGFLRTVRTVVLRRALIQLLCYALSIARTRAQSMWSEV